MTKKTKKIKKNSGFRLPPHEHIFVISALSQKQGWGITQCNIPNTWTVTDGEGETVMVIDTGWSNHIDLGENSVKGISTVGGKIDDKEGHGCVSPNTYIHTNFCGIEPIETLYNRIPIDEHFDINTKSFIKDVRSFGLKTYSLNSETGKAEIDAVQFLHKTPINGKIYNIELQGNINYKLTPWHPIYTYKSKQHKKFEINKKRADELQLTDRMLFNRGDIAGQLVNDYYRTYGLKYRICSTCGHKYEFKKERKNRWQCKNNCNKSIYKDEYSTYLVTENLAYLLGLILTDGHINNPKTKQYRVEITSTTPEILIAAKNKLDSLGFLGSYIRKERNRNISRLIIDNKEFHAILLNLGLLYYRKTYDQGLPECIGKSPYTVICAFLAGVIDGDGCISKGNSKNRITSVSKLFIEQLCCLFNSIGISSGYTKYKNYNSNKGFSIPKSGAFAQLYNCNFTKLNKIIVSFLSHPKKISRAIHQIDNIKYTVSSRKLKNITQEDYNGYFYDFTVKNNHTYLANGHFVSNTHCTGIIAAQNNETGMVGVAPKAKVIAVKALDDNGSGSFTAIAKALEYAIKIKPSVISMSLGSPTCTERIKVAIKKLYDMNIPIICAAGNSGSAGVDYPGKYPETIAIAAYDEKGKIANFSAIGKEVDFAAPGVGIYSTYLNNQYSILSGTSMACPFIAGVVALLLAKHKKQEADGGQNDCKTVEEIRTHLLKYTIDKGYVGKDNNWGYGVIDIEHMLLATNCSVPETSPENPLENKEPESITPPIKHKSFWEWFFGLFRNY